MTNQQMDKLIRAGQPVKFVNTHFQEEFTATPVSRKRGKALVRAESGYEAELYVDELEIKGE